MFHSGDYRRGGGWRRVGIPKFGCDVVMHPGNKKKVENQKRFVNS